MSEFKWEMGQGKFVGSAMHVASQFASQRLVNKDKPHKLRSLCPIEACFSRISAALRSRAVFYSTNRIYSASLTRLHAPPVSETPGYYRNLKPRLITGAVGDGKAPTPKLIAA